MSYFFPGSSERRTGTGGADTDLGIANRDATGLEITSSTGLDVEVPSATDRLAGLMAAADKAKLDPLPPLWAAGTTYAIGDQRSYNGKVYRRRTVGSDQAGENPAANTADWAPLGSATGGASSFEELTGQIADAQIPNTIARDSEIPTVPAKATNNDVDTETDDTKYVTVLKVFRAIARKVRNATSTVRGIVLIARNEDVEATETDLTRVPDVGRTKRLIERLVQPLFQRLFRGNIADASSEQIPGDITIQNSANVLYAVSATYDGNTGFVTVAGNVLAGYDGSSDTERAEVVAGLRLYASGGKIAIRAAGSSQVSGLAIWIVQSQALVNAMISRVPVALNRISQGGATAGQTLRWSGTAWAPADGVSHPGSHNRYIGWSVSAAVTAGEIAVADDTAYTTDVLTIPRRSNNGYLFFMVPESVGAPNAAYFDGNSHDILGAFDRIAGTVSVGGTDYIIYVTTVAQNARILGTGTRTLTLDYS